jgi:ubiquinone/menaquinone biosynthesis C-methylase UbiE
MRRMRRAYYDAFSRFYDRFVALHSRDSARLARRFLAERLPSAGVGAVLDLCTGTGTLLPRLQERVGRDGHVVGVDFSRGMLKVASAKIKGLKNIHLVEGDVGSLPFAAESFDAVTCSHAFYELRGDIREGTLREILRVLRSQGVFLMMEHDVPVNPLVKALFYVRLTVAGAGKAVAFLRREQEVLKARFTQVERITAPGGRSKVMVCWK